MLFEFLLHKRLSTFLAFRSSRSLRTVQRPRYVSFYQPKENTPEIIVTQQEAKQWLNEKNTNIFTHYSRDNHRRNISYTQMDLRSSKQMMSPIPSLSLSNKDHYPFVHMSSRRAGCTYFSFYDKFIDLSWIFLGTTLLNRWRCLIYRMYMILLVLFFAIHCVLNLFFFFWYLNRKRICFNLQDQKRSNRTCTDMLQVFIELYSFRDVNLAIIWDR